MAAPPPLWAAGVTPNQVKDEASLQAVYKMLKIGAPSDLAECPPANRLGYLQQWLAMATFFKGLTAVKPPIKEGAVTFLRLELNDEGGARKAGAVPRGR